MSEEKTNGKDEKGKDIKVDVKVDSKQMEEILERLKAEEQKRKEAEEQLKALAEEKEKLTKITEEKTAEAEDYRSKLQIIAEKEFEAQKKIILEKAKELIKDEARLKEIEDGLTTVEKLNQTKYMLEVLTQALTPKQEKEPPKPEPEPTEPPKPPEKPKGTAGTVPIEGQTSGGVGYDSYEAMIKDLYAKSRSSDPEVAAEAKSVLDEFFKKWAAAVRAEYGGKLPRGISISKEKQPSLREITKKGGEA